MRCGTPVSMTFIASLIAAGSTQPPEMEPRTFPSSFTARAAPGSRGADRSVAMSVTRATFFPSSNHSSTPPSTSIMTSTSASQGPLWPRDQKQRTPCRYSPTCYTGPMSDLPTQRDFDAMYTGTPPWDIGRPQGSLQAVADAGGIRGRVLDAGCGTGEHALMAAALGLDTTGVDGSPTAIDLARSKAAERGIPVRFVVADALNLGSLGETFDTVIDSGLFHVFDDDDRARYVGSLRAPTAPGARGYLLCLGARRVSEEEIRASFSDGWTIEAIDAVGFEVNFSPDPIPAWLATIARRG